MWHLTFAGSIGGDMAASVLGEQVMKGKSALQGEGFRSPYQKLSDDQQAQLAEAIRADVMRQYGLIAPGTIQYADPSTGMGVS